MTATFVAGAGAQNNLSGLRGIKVRLAKAAERAAAEQRAELRRVLADLADRPFAAENWQTNDGEYRTTTYTRPQLLAAWILARGHHHGWAFAVRRADLTETMTRGEISDLAYAQDPNGILGPGLRDNNGYVWHCTTSFRTVWRVSTTGDVRVWLFDGSATHQDDVRLSSAQFVYDIAWGGGMGGVVQSVGPNPGKGPAGSERAAWPCAVRWDNAYICNVFGPFGWAKRTGW